MSELPATRGAHDPELIREQTYAGALVGLTDMPHMQHLAKANPVVFSAQIEIAKATDTATLTPDQKALLKFDKVVRGVARVSELGLIPDADTGNDLAYTLMITDADPTSMLRYLNPENVGSTRLERALTAAELINVLVCYDDFTDDTRPDEYGRERVDKRRPSVATIARAAMIAGVSLEFPIADDHLASVVAVIENSDGHTEYSRYIDSREGPIRTVRKHDTDFTDTGLASDGALNPTSADDSGAGTSRDRYIEDFEAYSGAPAYPEDGDNWNPKGFDRLRD